WACPLPPDRLERPTIFQIRHVDDPFPPISAGPGRASSRPFRSTPDVPSFPKGVGTDGWCPSLLDAVPPPDSRRAHGGIRLQLGAAPATRRLPQAQPDPPLGKRPAQGPDAGPPEPESRLLGPGRGRRTPARAARGNEPAAGNKRPGLPGRAI